MSRVSKVPVHLFYDVMSPYSWIAFELVCRYQHVWNIDLRLRPAFLRGIKGAAGNIVPSKKKVAYEIQDLARSSIHFQIPLQMPPSVSSIMVAGSLSAMRLLTAANTTYPHLTEDMSRALWLRLFHTHEDITQTDSLLQVCRGVGLVDKQSHDLVKVIGDTVTKDKLKEVTQEALSYGAFGVPTMVAHCGGESHMIFGSDRIHILGHIIGEKYQGPLTQLAKIKL